MRIPGHVGLRATRSRLCSFHAPWSLQVVERIRPSIQQGEKIVEGVTALIPGGSAQTALAIERLAFGVLGDVAAAVIALDQADLAKGVNVTLDAEVAAAVKTLVTDFRAEFQTAGLLKTAPIAKAA